MSIPSLPILSAACVALILPSDGSAETKPPPLRSVPPVQARPGQAMNILYLLIKPRPGFSSAELQSLMRALGARLIDQQEKLGLWRYSAPEGREQAVIDALSKHPGIEFAEPERALSPAGPGD